MNLINYKNFTINQRFIFLITSFIIFVSLILYFVISPTINTIKTTKDLIIAQKIDLERKINRERNASNINKQINKIEPELKRFENIFINNNRELEFIITLEGIANNNNVNQIINLSPNNSPDNKSYSITPLSLNAQGKFIDLMNYLNDLETLSYHLNINTINLNKNEHITNSNKETFSGATMIISANSYWK